MILVTHALVGTAFSHRYSSGLTAFFVGCVSHYIFDMIPHWHYKNRWIKKIYDSERIRAKNFRDPDAWGEIVRVLIDLSLGVGLSLVFFSAAPEVIVAGAFGAMLPDLLIAFSKFWPQKILNWHREFHHWVHADIRLDDMPILGIGSQIVIAVLCILLFR